MTKIYNQKLTTKIIIFLALLTICLVFSLVFSNKAIAITTNNSNLPNEPSVQRHQEPNGRGYCIFGGQTWKHALNQWISPEGQHGSKPVSFTVDPGSSLPLSFNFMGNHCVSNLTGATLGGSLINKSPQETRANIVSASTNNSNFTVSGLTGYLEVDWSKTYGGSTGLPELYYAKEFNGTLNSNPVHDDFSVRANSNVAPGSYRINIRVEIRPVNHSTEGYICTIPGDGSVPANGQLTGTNCDTTTLVVPITIVVPDDTVVSLPIANCDELQGFAYKSGSSAVYNVDVFKDGVKVSNISNVPANQASATPGSPQDGHVFRIDISDHKDLSSHEWQVKLTNNSSVVSTVRNVGPCATVSCTSNVIPSTIEPDVDFEVQITGSITYFGSRGGSPPDFRAIYAIRNSDSGATVSSPSSQSWGTWSSSKTFTFDVAGGIRNVDNYRIDGRINWTGAPVDPTDSANTGVSCDTEFDVSWVPYMKFYGNDIYAGSTFISQDPMCGPKESDIIGDSNYSNTANKGSSVEYASFATGSTVGLFTAGMRIGSGLPTNVPTGLAFGNFEVGGQPKKLIGDYNGKRCLPDFNDIVPDSITPISGNRTTSGLGLGTVSGDRYIVINGNLTIDNNVVLADFSGIGQIPNLIVVVNGDITISRNVTDVQGVFIAQPTSLINGGNVHTCGRLAVSRISNDCIRQLRFKGALVAQHVDFYRSNGLLKDAINNEPIGSDNISESYEFLPEIYVRQTRDNNKADIDVRYDFITSLPPVL